MPSRPCSSASARLSTRNEGRLIEAGSGLTGLFGGGDRPSASTVRRLLVLSLPSIAIGIVSALVLYGVDELAGLLQFALWDALPNAVGVAPDTGWWIVLILTTAGCVIGLVLWLMPGHGGRDSATSELLAPPIRILAVPSLLIVTIIALGSGVSLGPENPIIAVNTAILVAVLGRLIPGMPPNLIVITAAAATIGALFGTPVAAALVFTGVVASIAGGGELWDRLFLPLLAAGAGAVTTTLVSHPEFAVPLPAYDAIAPIDLLSACVIAAIAAALGIAAAAIFPTIHAGFRLLRSPILYVTLGGLILGLFGALGGPITLFKGVDQMAELVVHRGDYGVGPLVVIVLVKVAALIVAAAAGFRGGRIFPAVFIGAAIGVLANAIIPSIPVTVAVASAVLGMVLAVSRDGWIAIFIAVAVSGSIVVLAVLCIAILPAWLLVSRAPAFMVAERPESAAARPD